MEAEHVRERGLPSGERKRPQVMYSDWMKWLVKGVFHYWLGRRLFRKGEHHWIKAQWHFLLAVTHFAKFRHAAHCWLQANWCVLLMHARLDRVCALLAEDAHRYQTKIRDRQEESLRERERDAERQRLLAIHALRYRRLMKEYDGDIRKLNLPLFLTHPE